MKAKLSNGQRYHIGRDLTDNPTDYCEDFVKAKRAQARKYGITVDEVQAIYEAYHVRRFDRRVAELKANAAERRKARK